MAAIGTRFDVSSWSRRVAVLALAWLGLNGGDPGSWIVGIPVVLAAATVGASLQTPTAPRVRWIAVAPFLAYFVIRSLLGGWDVARCALRWRMPIAPGFVRFETTLPPGVPQVLFAGTVSLLPGTLVAGADGPDLTVHTLDTARDLTGELRGLERRVSALFDASPTASRPRPC